MFLFFDTETTGTPKKEGTLDGQPHVCQLAFIVTDENARIIHTNASLITPSGWIIPERLVEIHGISTELANRYGSPMCNKLSEFHHYARKCSHIIGHNLEFDQRMMDIESARIEQYPVHRDPKSVCTMRITTPILGLTNKRNQPKWPKLSEAYEHFFQEPLVGAHDALVDVRATARIFFRLIHEGLFDPHT